MINYISTSDVRQVLAVSQQVDEALIASAVHSAQVKLLNEVLPDYEVSLDDRPLLAHMKDVLAYAAGIDLVDALQTQLMPTQIANSLKDGDPNLAKQRFQNALSAALKAFYKYCEDEGIPHNKYNSTSFCSIHLGGHRAAPYGSTVRFSHA